MQTCTVNKCKLALVDSVCAAVAGFAYMNGVDGGETDEGIQDDAVIGSTSDVPDDGPDFANMNGGSETTAAASSSETASVTGRSFCLVLGNYLV